MMMRWGLTQVGGVLAVCLSAAASTAAQDGPTDRGEPAAPGVVAGSGLLPGVKVISVGEAVSANYASPGWADVDGDGHGDLLVGQLSQARVRVYPGDGAGTFGAGYWLEAGGGTATFDSVW